MKKIAWISLVLIMGSYSACHWDYYASNYLFEKYCAEDGRTGLFMKQLNWVMNTLCLFQKIKIHVI